MNLNPFFKLITLVLVILGFVIAWTLTRNSATIVTNFEQCVAAGNVVLESYPRQCKAGEQTYAEDVGVACTMEAKLCPDGSYVGRTGPRCEFTACPTSKPSTITQCLKDSDCSSPSYTCEETQGAGTACPNTDPTCVPTHTVISGECKLKTNKQCKTDSECSAGNLCHKNICTAPIGRECGGVSDTSCPTDFQCVQGCGPPVVRDPDTTPVKYYCQLNGYNRSCPICLAKDTLIDTPLGAIPVQDLQKGMPVWTVNKLGSRLVAIIIETSKTAAPPDHKMVKLILSDGRTLLVSPGHPTAKDLTVGDLQSGDLYDGARIISADRVFYADGYTYDILPSGDTGEYFANGILIGSTLR